MAATRGESAIPAVAGRGGRGQGTIVTAGIVFGLISVEFGIRLWSCFEGQRGSVKDKTWSVFTKQTVFKLCPNAPTSVLFVSVLTHMCLDCDGVWGGVTYYNHTSVYFMKQTTVWIGVSGVQTSV